MLVAMLTTAHAYDPGSSEANDLRMVIFYHDVCPYGRLKIPERLWDEVSERWAYIPDGTKRRAITIVSNRLEDNDVATFCASMDEWYAKNYPKGNPLEAKKEKVPEFGIVMVEAARETRSRYVFYTVVYNGTAEDRGTTEWICVLNNAKKKVYEENVKVENVKANSRVVTRHVFDYDGNADNVTCK
jgi:hypothetical protein